MGIFIDPRKAFDTIDHGVLLKKLEFYGIQGVPSVFFGNLIFQTIDPRIKNFGLGTNFFEFIS